MIILGKAHRVLQKWSRLVKNSSRIFLCVSCMCLWLWNDREFTEGNDPHFMCFVIFWDLQRELRARHVYLSFILLFLLLNFDFMTARNLSAALNEIRRRQKGHKIHFHFISLPRSTAATWDFFICFFWCCFVYVYKNENAFFMPSYVFC